jgi:hypothetical protein
VKHFNLRWLLFTVVIIALVGGGLFGWNWWVNRPEYLYESALKYYNQGLENQRLNVDQAREAFESADKQLRTLLQKLNEMSKEPQKDKEKQKKFNQAMGQALVLHARVLRELVAYAAEDEKNDPSKPRTNKLENDRLNAWANAAQIDPTNHLAQWEMMNYYMGRHEYGLPPNTDPLNSAGPYAINLMDLKKEDYVEDAQKDYALQQVSVYYVLAWKAYHERSPQKALDFLRKGDEFDQQDFRAGGKSGAPVPRWREPALEAQALAELKKRAAGKKDKNEEAAEQLRSKLQDGLVRALSEAEEKLPERTKEGLFKESVPRTRTVAWLAVTDSPTDLPGLLDFLWEAVKQAGGPEEVLQTTKKVIQVCAKLAEDPQPPPSVLKTLEKFLQGEKQGNKFLHGLSSFAAETQAKQKRGETRPSAKEWLELHAQIAKVLKTVLTKNKESNPSSYTALAQTALERIGTEKDLEDALKDILNGLENVKSAQEKNKDAPEKTRKELLKVEMGLRLFAAEAYLRLGQTAKAAEQLALVRKSSISDLQASAYALEGMVAIRTGRLEQGVRLLKEAFRLSEGQQKRLAPQVYLAYAYLALGRPADALPHLTEVQKRYAKFDDLSLLERYEFQKMVPNDHTLNLNIMRCLLALGREREALKYKERLKDLSQAKFASLALVQFYLTQAAKKEAGSTEQVEIHQKAQKEIAAAVKADPEDVQLAWANVVVLLSTPGQSQSALLPQAEKLLDNYRKKYPNNVEAGLLWVRWLRSRNKDAEAEKALQALEKHFANKEDESAKRRLKFERLRMEMAKGATKDSAAILKGLLGEKPDVNLQLLEAFLAAREGNDQDAQQKLKDLFDNHAQNGLVNYANGWMAQRRSRWKEAIRFYERSLQFANLTRASEQGLFYCLRALSTTEGPAEANKAAFQALQNNPTDPALLIAFAWSAIDMDNIYGDLNLQIPYGQGNHGMEGALAALADMYAKKKGEEVMGPYFMAQGWAFASRPDRARKEALPRALKIDPKHVPSLLLAIQLAQQDEDWKAVLRYAAALENAKASPLLVLTARAQGLVNLDQLSQAKALYQQLKKDFELQFVGYQGLALLAEKAKDYAGALAQVQAWLDRVDGKNFDEDEAFQMKVRLLARLDKVEQARKYIDGYVKDWLRPREKNLKEQVDKAKLSDEQKKKALENGQEVLAFAEINLLLRAAAGFSEAEAFDAAEKLLQETLNLADKRPKANRINASKGPQLALANLYLNRRTSSKAADKKGDAQKAIEWYEKVRVNFPHDVQACNNLAWLLNEQKADKDRILRVAKDLRTGRYSDKRISGERLNINVLDTLGVVYHDCGEDKEAYELFMQAMLERDNKTPGRYYDDPRVMIYLGQAMKRLGQEGDANQTLTRASKLATENADKAPNATAKARWEKIASKARQAREGK